MIVFSAFLVAVAVGLLVAGVVTSKLWLVYLAIGVSGVSLLMLGLGAILKRKELFGKARQAEPVRPQRVAAQVPAAPRGPRAPGGQPDLDALPEPMAPPVGSGWSVGAQSGTPRAGGYLPPDQSMRIRPPAVQQPADDTAGHAAPADALAAAAWSPSPSPAPSRESGVPLAPGFPPAPGFPSVADLPPAPSFTPAATFTPAASLVAPPVGQPPAERDQTIYAPAGGGEPVGQDHPAGTDEQPAESQQAAPDQTEAAKDETAKDQAVKSQVTEDQVTQDQDQATGDQLAPVQQAAPEPEPEPEPEPAAQDEQPPAAEHPSPASAPRTDGGPEPAEIDLLREVTVVPGVPRYHNAQCILIRFMGEGDLNRMPLGEARQSGYTPCRACQPDQAQVTPA